MAVALKQTGGTVITQRLAEIIPGYRTFKVTKQLLSGSYSTQTIGTGARIVTIKLFADATNRDLLNTYESQGTPIRLEDGATYYIGIIEAAPNWSRLVRGVYQTTIVLLVTEEGSL
jgi:hypothetical protein